MLTDEERKNLERLRKMDARLNDVSCTNGAELDDIHFQLARAAPKLGRICERLDAELSAFKTYMELEHAKLHEEHRDRMKAESELAAARAEGERVRELLKLTHEPLCSLTCQSQWETGKDRLHSQLCMWVAAALRPHKEPSP